MVLEEHKWVVGVAPMRNVGLVTLASLKRPRLTTRSPRLTARSPRLTAGSPRLTARLQLFHARLSARPPHFHDRLIARPPLFQARLAGRVPRIPGVAVVWHTRRPVACKALETPAQICPITFKKDPNLFTWHWIVIVRFSSYVFGAHPCQELTVFLRRKVLNGFFYGFQGGVGNPVYMVNTRFRDHDLK